MVKGPTPLTKKRNEHKRTKGFLRFQSDMFPRMAVSKNNNVLYGIFNSLFAFYSLFSRERAEIYYKIVKNLASRTCKDNC